MPWPQNHYHVKLGLLEKGRSIVVWLGSMIYRMGLVTSGDQDGYRAQVPQHPIDSD